MKLFDAHAHTTVSYCAAPDLTVDVYRAALDDPAGCLGRQAITNHGFQAYFPEDIAWSCHSARSGAKACSSRARACVFRGTLELVE